MEQIRVMNGIARVGDKVMVGARTPKRGWGVVTKSSVGTLSAIGTDGLNVLINFPEQRDWMGIAPEIMLVEEPAENLAPFEDLSPSQRADFAKRVLRAVFENKQTYHQVKRLVEEHENKK